MAARGTQTEKSEDSAAYTQVRPMYVRNDFSFKNVLGAAYNRVRFIVWNLRYVSTQKFPQNLPIQVKKIL